VIGLHILMCILAQHRTGHELYDGLTKYDGPSSRETVNNWPGEFPASAEYWAIYDRIERGETP